MSNSQSSHKISWIRMITFLLLLILVYGGLLYFLSSSWEDMLRGGEPVMLDLDAAPNEIRTARIAFQEKVLRNYGWMGIIALLFYGVYYAIISKVNVGDIAVQWLSKRLIVAFGIFMLAIIMVIWAEFFRFPSGFSLSFFESLPKLFFFVPFSFAIIAFLLIATAAFNRRLGASLRTRVSVGLIGGLFGWIGYFSALLNVYDGLGAVLEVVKQYFSRQEAHSGSQFILVTQFDYSVFFIPIAALLLMVIAMLWAAPPELGTVIPFFRSLTKHTGRKEAAGHDIYC